MAEAKTKNGSGFTILIIIVSISILMYLFWDKIKPYIFKNQQAKTDSNVSPGYSVPLIDTNTVLEKGMNNGFVVLLQELLNLQLQKNGKKVTDINIPGYSCNANYLTDEGLLVADGDFGSCTEMTLLYLTGKKEFSVSGLTAYFGFSIEDTNTNVNVYENYSGIPINTLQDFFNWITFWD